MWKKFIYNISYPFLLKLNDVSFMEKSISLIMSLIVSPIKRVRRSNEVFPSNAPPENVLKYRLCHKHELYSLHNCPRCVVEKREATMLARHGVKSALYSKEIMKKKNETCLERYDTIHTFQSEKVKQKIVQSNLKKYGVEHTLQLKEIREKGNKTMMEKYRVEHACQSKEVLAKRVDTNLQKFGVEAPLQSREVLERRKKTNLERYQTEEVLQNKAVQQRVQNTMLERYQVCIPLQNKEIKARKDATCEERYGNAVIMHVPELFEKKTINSFARKPLTLPSGTIIYYQGYEDVAIRELLQDHKEEEIINDVKVMPECMYSWKGKNHRYYPDLYLPRENKFIEVKSKYTYLNQREQNQTKRACVLGMGYEFEFWICDKKEVLYKTGGWETDEEVPWYISKRVKEVDEKEELEDEKEVE